MKTKWLLLVAFVVNGLAFVPVQRSDAQIELGLPEIGTGPGINYGYPHFEYGYYPRGGYYYQQPYYGYCPRTVILFASRASIVFPA